MNSSWDVKVTNLPKKIQHPDWTTFLSRFPVQVHVHVSVSLNKAQVKLLTSSRKGVGKITCFKLYAARTCLQKLAEAVRLETVKVSLVLCVFLSTTVKVPLVLSVFSPFSVNKFHIVSGFTGSQLRKFHWY